MTRYTTKAVARAREHQKAGWPIPEIPGLLEREFGRRPQRVTVEGWLDEERAEKRRTTQREAKRRRKGPGVYSRVSEDWKLEQMRRLREADLSFWAISAVARVWWGEDISDERVARALGEGRVSRRGAVAGRRLMLERELAA